MEKVRVARSEELPAAFELVFQHIPERDRSLRVANALEMLRQHTLDPLGVFVVDGTAGLEGAVVCAPVPAAGALIWPPHARAAADSRDIEDRLIRRACSWLRQRGTKICQCLLDVHDLCLAEPLLRNGFAHVTHLWYMRHDLRIDVRALRRSLTLTFRPYPEAPPQLFHETLLQTYVDTSDCPEVNGVRTIDEVISGHQSQGKHLPEQWWLALHDDDPVGVLLLTEMPDWFGWDLIYLGIAAPARRHGYGRQLTTKAILEALAAGAQQLTLSVDSRNLPAWNLYRALGFEAYDRREIVLAIWK